MTSQCPSGREGRILEDIRNLEGIESRKIVWNKLSSSVFVQCISVILEIKFSSSWSGFMVCVNVSHEWIAWAVHAFTHHTAVLFLPLCMLVRNVTLETSFGTQHFSAALTREHFLQTPRSCKIKNKEKKEKTLIRGWSEKEWVPYLLRHITGHNLCKNGSLQYRLIQFETSFLPHFTAILLFSRDCKSGSGFLERTWNIYEFTRGIMDMNYTSCPLHT